MNPRDDIVSPIRVRWDSWKSVDPRTIEVTFLAGPASCDGVSAVVKEASDSVTIDLSTGPLPGGSGECAAVALKTTTRATLQKPLDGREVRQT
jgi:hypothetical protein